MDLLALADFNLVATHGGFGRASRESGRSKATLSRRVADLEKSLGVRLIERGTHSLRLTEEGKALHARTEHLLGEIAEVGEALAEGAGTPRGRLRVSSPVVFAHVALGRLAARFMEKHPEVQLEMVCTDRTVHLVEEGFDVAVRAGKLADSSLIARRLGSIGRVAVAAPEYLQARGTPRTPKELEKHDCLHFGSSLEGNTWTLHAGARSVEVPLRTRLAVNEPDMLRALTLAGAGIALLPNAEHTADLTTGRLKRLLPEWTSAEAPVHAVYSSTRHHSPKVMAFVDFLREHWPDC